MLTAYWATTGRTVLAWMTVTASRDIYRYVTFVRDAAGNWSQVGSYTLLTNADRSTNYWLGDFSLHAGNPPSSRGVVEGVDLGLSFAHYFQSVPPVCRLSGYWSGRSRQCVRQGHSEPGSVRELLRSDAVQLQLRRDGCDRASRCRFRPVGTLSNWMPCRSLW